MFANRLQAGAKFPMLQVVNLAGDTHDISQPAAGADWRMVVVYRGRHCPLCTKFLNALETYQQRLAAIGIDVAVVSADSKAQLREHKRRLEISYPIYYGLSLEQMAQLGLYVSHPRSEQETDHPFAEPGLFIINAEGNVQVVDISNNPFVRPELETLVSGLEWIRSNSYPIRGTYEMFGLSA